MREPIASPFLVPFDGDFAIAERSTRPPGDSQSKKSLKKSLDDLTDTLSDLQRIFYASGRYAMLLIFQAMDAAGKDSTIRAVMKGVDPAGCHVHSFKQPSTLELSHDFLWRTTLKLPARREIVIFNRSYYEEVLVVRVHPELLEAQRLPDVEQGTDLWGQRFASIVAHEQHLARNGTVILKFWLNVSREEQRQRFLSRLDEPHKNWKFSRRDVEERGFWDHYMQAYQAALTATSRPWAPWYAIPANDKDYMRMAVADLIVARLRSLGLTYPRSGPEESRTLAQLREALEAQ